MVGGWLYKMTPLTAVHIISASSDQHNHNHLFTHFDFFERLFGASNQTLATVGKDQKHCVYNVQCNFCNAHMVYF